MRIRAAVPDVRTIEDVLTYVRSRAEKTEPGHWITLSQVFITPARRAALSDSCGARPSGATPSSRFARTRMRH
jgi:hypothetical protein